MYLKEDSTEFYWKDSLG